MARGMTLEYLTFESKVQQEKGSHGVPYSIAASDDECNIPPALQSIIIPTNKVQLTHKPFYD